jgi:phage terminase small subunit
MTFEGMGIVIDIQIASSDVAPILIAVGTLVTAVTSSIGVLVSMMNRRNLNAVKQDVQAVKSDVKVVHENTNGAKERAVVASHKDGFMLGNIQGRIEQIIEEDEKRSKAATDKDEEIIERDRRKEYGP